MNHGYGGPAISTENTRTDLSLDWLVSNLRWGWLVLIALYAGLEYYFTPQFSPNFQRLLLLLFVGIVLNSIYAGLLWARFFPPWLGLVTVILDIVFAVGLLLLLDHSLMLMLPLMIFPVLIGAGRFGAETGVLIIFPLIIGYGLRLIPLLQNNFTGDVVAESLFALASGSLVLFLAGVLPGIFVREWVRTSAQQNKAELEALRIENQRAKLISEMALTLGSTVDYRKVLRAMVDLAFSALAEVGRRDESVIGMVLLFEDDATRLTVAAGRNIARSDEGRRVPADQGLIGHTIHTAEATITNNVQKDRVLTSFASTPGCRSAICAPLRAGFTTYGVVLFLSTQPNFYQAEHKKLLTTFCSQAIIALQNAQLFEDLHREQQRILEKEAEARRKLARDLHDGPTQSIAAIAMRLNFIKMLVQNNETAKAYEELVKVEEIAHRTTHEIRTMLFAMRPVILETQGLVPALNQLADRLNVTEPFSVRVVNRGYDGQLSKDAEGVVFAIVEEAIGNAKKHAEASEILIALSADAERLVVEIKDNGVGFDVKKTISSYDQRTSLGLINMDERAQLVGGECTIDSARGKGTTVHLEIPFKKSGPESSAE
ncbi:MAG: GAF domain-containing sensor histidine kinase [Chloroflexi bacterium]|nr:MAG: GAF domain-containing sensor histidine kinase [Chloroflexota bacterium]